MRRSQAASWLVDVDRVPWVAMMGSHACPVVTTHTGVAGSRRRSRFGPGWLELVVLTGGQMPVAGAADGIGALGSPDGSPGRDPQPWSALAGELGPAGEGSR